MLTKRQAEIIRMMAEAEGREDYEDAEIVCEGLVCYLGLVQVSRKSVSGLLRHMAISLASEPGAAERYVLSGSGRRMVDEPEIADRLVAALIDGRPVDAAGKPMK